MTALFTDIDRHAREGRPDHHHQRRRGRQPHRPHSRQPREHGGRGGCRLRGLALTAGTVLLLTALAHRRDSLERRHVLHPPSGGPPTSSGGNCAGDGRTPLRSRHQRDDVPSRPAYRARSVRDPRQSCEAVQLVENLIDSGGRETDILAFRRPETNTNDGEHASSRSRSAAVRALTVSSCHERAAIRIVPMPRTDPLGVRAQDPELTNGGQACPPPVAGGL